MHQHSLFNIFYEKLVESYNYFLLDMLSEKEYNTIAII